MRATAVLERGGPWWASQQNMAAAVLGRRPGVLDVEVNPVSETATVVFDPTATSLAELRDWVVECGYHCAGQSVPAHLCDPMAEPDPPAQADRTRPAEHGGDVAVAEPPADARHAPEPMPSPHEVMGHGGHADMSMAAMVADMRNRLRGPTPGRAPSLLTAVQTVRVTVITDVLRGVLRRLGPSSRWGP
ncbi:heavy-metal-associated domain-containing protein [Streptomyces sp. NPDC051445]|uniref:heavy-metal-associated domain-containing protein n=1 Tax=Streptomyces sp. NPDC051445 TaxID=3365653 RepID=UPI0037A383A4